MERLIYFTAGTWSQIPWFTNCWFCWTCIACGEQYFEFYLFLQECEVRGDQPAITPIRRSVRFHRGDKSLTKPLVEKESHHKQTPRTPKPRDIAHNKKTHNAVKKDKIRENPTRIQRSAAVRASARLKQQNDLQTLYEDSQDVPARRKNKKSELPEPKPSCCEESTRKRKRGADRKPASRKQSQLESKSDCPEIVPITEPRNIIHKKNGNDPSPTVQAKIGDDTLVNTKECNDELSGIKGGIQQQCCASDDWTEEQDLTLRQAYFTARPSPHFWKKVSKMVLPILLFLFLKWSDHILVVARAVWYLVAQVAIGKHHSTLLFWLD